MIRAYNKAYENLHPTDFSFVPHGIQLLSRDRANQDGGQHCYHNGVHDRQGGRGSLQCSWSGQNIQGRKRGREKGRRRRAGGKEGTVLVEPFSKNIITFLS
jgi:hypothetical protein